MIKQRNILSCMLVMLAMHLPFVTLAASNYTGPKACAECHELEYNAWKQSHHFTSYKDLSRTPLAKAMKKALGIKRLKKEKECVTCHFMTKTKGGKEKAVSGPNCESCHGAAKNWINVHGDFGGKDAKKADESAGDKQKRWAKSEKAGLIRPKHRVRIIKNCLGCHVVKKSHIINKTEHPARSEFEWVAWFSGEVNHRVWYNDGKSNARLPKKAQRHFYVLAQLLDGAETLRAISKSQQGKYCETHKKHFESLKPKLKRLSQVGVDVPNLDIDLSDTKALKALANQLESRAKKTTASQTNQGAVDAWLPKPKDYKGDLWKP